MQLRSKFFIFALLLFSCFQTTWAADDNWNKIQTTLQQRPDYFTRLYHQAQFYLSGRWRTRTVGERNPNINSDEDYQAEKKFQNGLGRIASYYDRELQTRIYYSATGKPDENGQVPVVDPDSKALFIYFHGSGTENGSGSNFNYKGNRLAALGYSSLSFDYPFHQDGPINSKFGSASQFIDYIHDMIAKFRVSGQPVYLVGHSFGVNVIADYLTRFPDDVNGAVLLSPCGYNEELAKWAQEKTVPMLKAFPHFSFNEMGAKWASYVNRGFIWTKIGKKPGVDDPTVANPSLRLRIVSGEREEFIPGPLDENGMPTAEPRTYDVLGDLKRNYFANATTILEPGVGHLVQSYTDPKGLDLVIRELLAVDQVDPSQSKEISEKVSAARSRKITELDLALQKMVLDPLFRQWMTGTYGEDYLMPLMTKKVEAVRMSRRVLGDYKKFDQWRMDLIKKKPHGSALREDVVAAWVQQNHWNLAEREKVYEKPNPLAKGVANMCAALFASPSLAQ